MLAARRCGRVIHGHPERVEKRPSCASVSSGLIKILFLLTVAHINHSRRDRFLTLVFCVSQSFSHLPTPSLSLALVSHPKASDKALFPFKFFLRFELKI
ncbi:hypothetical protein K1719_027116 [Acacia pycnantha]|nr:hypothetical protein K1719_027116 [Acacia pycnantha]